MQMKALQVFTVSTLLAILPTLTSAASPPKLPGKTYITTADGCGFLVDDASLADASTKQYWDAQAKKYWVGICNQGLLDGTGFFYDPANTGSLMEFSNETFLMGEDAFLAMRFAKPIYSVLLPNQHSHGFNAQSGSFEYQVFDMSPNKSSSLYNIQVARFPVTWTSELRLKPAFNPNDGTGGDDIRFVYSGKLPGNEAYETPIIGMTFEAKAKSCDELKVKIKGCSPPGKIFDVYGISIEGLKIDGVDSFDPQFIVCPNPRSSVGCETVWQNSVGKYIDAMVSHAQVVSKGVTEQNAMLAEKRKAIVDKLPGAWKAHWSANPLNRTAIETSLNCREISDYGPISLADAQYIQKKYSSAPCNSALVASAVLARVNNYIALESKTTARRAQQIADLDQYNRDRAQARNEAWAGFFNSMNAMLTMQMQIQQQRIDNTNAQIAASNQQQQSAPAYQSYGQPLAASSGQQSYDPSKVQTRAIHKPELDAGSCVKLVQLANGDPLSSFGSQVFSNQCGQTVEVFWCKVGDECERGAGGMTTVAAGKSWPVTSGQYRYGACLGANSGALVRDASGVHTGRYACTGP